MDRVYLQDDLLANIFYRKPDKIVINYSTDSSEFLENRKLF